jgi:PKD repeat protein
MKRTWLILLMPILIFCFNKSSEAQCVIDSSQTGAGIYPDTLPDGTAGVFYDEDITFVMLTDTLGLTIYSYRIANIVGLPIGISWQCNNFQTNCVYDPSVSLYGCVKLSGTPVLPGNYTMTVTVIADVQLVGTQTINFDKPLVILPGTVSNPGFSMTNNVGCTPLTVDFTNNNPGQASYLWDFGNGLQSTLENPPSQTYNNPGTYVVSQTVVPNTTPDYYLTNIQVTSIPNNYGGFVDDPDMYFLLYDPQGALIYDSHPSISNTHPPVSWTLPNIPLQNGTYTVHVWDEDGGLFGADDDLGSITFAGHGTSGSATGTVSGASGTLNVNYTIFSTPIVPLTATDTIFVYASPVAPQVSASGPLTICENETLTLTANDTTNSLQWYHDGLIMIGETSLLLTPVVSGTYHVVASTPQGCTASSSPVNVTIHPLPQKPTFFINGNTFTTGVTGVSLQWYYNGNPIPGATGSSLTATLNGTYQLCGTDVNGCINCSDTLAYINTGIADFHSSGFMLFPNPTADGSFTILFSGESGLMKEVHIYDLSGRLIEGRNQISENEVRFQETLLPGTYMIVITQGQATSRQKLVVGS